MKIKQPKKILLLIIKDIGDVMLTTPLAEVLHANFPNAQIDILATSLCAESARHNPFINNIVLYDKKAPVKMLWKVRARKYDWIIDFLSNPRSAMICALSGATLRAGNEKNHHGFYSYNFKFKYPKGEIYNPDLKLGFLRQLGIKWEGHAPLAKYYFTPEQLIKVDEIFISSGLNPKDTFFAFSPFSRNPFRCWALKNYKILAEKIHQTYPNAKILVISAPNEETALKDFMKDMPPYVLAAPKTETLETLLLVLSRVKVLVTSCGGTKHLALASGCATVTIHTINFATSWTPTHSPRHIGLQAPLKCSPCFGGCENPICQTSITPETVFTAFEKVLKN